MEAREREAVPVVIFFRPEQITYFGIVRTVAWG